MTTLKSNLALIVLTLATLATAMDVTIVFQAIPSIVRTLDATPSEALWVSDVYGYVLAGLLVTAGVAGDRFGHRRMLIIGGCAFTVMSVAAAMAPSPLWLIIFRAGMGAAGAALMPCSFALVFRMFEGARRSRSIGVLVSAFTFGTALGPVVAGLILENYYWGVVFLPAAIACLILVAAAPFTLPAAENLGDNAASSPIDLTSSLFLLIGFVAGAWTIKGIAIEGTIVHIAVGASVTVLFFAIFTRRQSRSETPFLDIKLFSNPKFSATLLLLAALLAADGGVYFLIAQNFQESFRLTPLTSGLLLIIPALILCFSAALIPTLFRRFGSVAIATGSIIIAIFGLAFLAFSGANTLLVCILGLSIFYLALGPVMTLGNEMVISAAPPDQRGAASGVCETVMQLSLSIGVTLFGSLGLVIYRNSISNSDTADGLTDGIKSSPSGSSDQLASDHSAAGTVFDASSSSLAVTSAVAAALILTSFVVAAYLWNRTNSSSRTESLIGEANG